MKSLKRIKSKIKAVSHLEKVTEAMEKVAAVKMRKISEIAARSRLYALKAMKILADLKSRTDPALHPFFQDKYSSSNIFGLVLLTSNKGLCGSFNSKLFELAKKFIEDVRKAGGDAEIICVGKKGKDYFSSHRELKPMLHFIEIGEEIIENDVENISRLSIDNYLNKKYSKILLLYNDFISTTIQHPVFKQILPLDRNYIKNFLSEHGNKENLSKHEYVFEPSAAAVLSKIVAELIQVQIFQALLDSKNSEYSQRYFVMKNAAEKSGEIVNELQLEFNKMRQALITQEIAEVTAGQIRT